MNVNLSFDELAILRHMIEFDPFKVKTENITLVETASQLISLIQSWSVYVT